MSLSAFSIDITLPLFSVIAIDLGTPIGNLPLTITLYTVSTGVGLIVFGALSDRFGRRSVLLFGMCVFVFGAILAAFAYSLTLLTIARAIQGFGAAAPYILSRTIIRDLYTAKELAQKMAIATGIFSIGPMLAPLLGALVLETGANWRWIFILMVIYCIGMIVTLKFVPETISQKNTDATKFATLTSNTKIILAHQQSRTFILITAIIMTSMLLIISTSASVYANTFNITGTPFAFYYAAHTIGIIVGQIANHRLIDNLGIVPTSMLASLVMLFSALSIAACAMTDNLTPWGVSLSITIFALGLLGVVANATSMLLQPHGNIIGFTTALQGTLTMLFSGLMVSLLSGIVQNNITVWALVIAIGPALVLILLYQWQTKHK